MIMCDYCGEFYHTKCIGIKEGDVHKIGSYKCNNCHEKGYQEILYQGTTKPIIQ